MKIAQSVNGKSAVLAILVLGAMVWLAAGSDDWRSAFPMSGPKVDYYDLLAQGFHEGHLYINAKVDPGLLSPDPEVRRRAPILTDVSLYHGRYYLYFGVVPAAFLFLPYLQLTGQDLPQNAATLLLVAVGFLLYLRLYLDAKRVFFPGISTATGTICVCLLAFASGTPALLVPSGTYEVAISGGYCGLAAFWLCVFRAWQSERHRPGWLALAGLAFGLAVGSRPNYVFALPVLAAAALFARGADLRAPTGIRPRQWINAFGAALGPAALVGACLMLYNYARFGNPFELGLGHQIGDVRIGSPFFFWSNLACYYLRPPVLSPYFPYVFPISAGGIPSGYDIREAVHGQWPAFLLATLCGLRCVLGLRRAAPSRCGLAPFFRLIAAGFICLFAGLIFLNGRTDRYMVDFQGSLVLLLALAGAYWAASDPPARHGSSAWRIAFGALAASTVLDNVMASLQLENQFEYTRPRSYRFLSYYGNYPSQVLADAGLLHYGPIRFKAVFPAVGKVTEETLLATGTPNYTDVVEAFQYPGGQVELSLMHEGYGTLRTGPFPIQPGREYRFEVDLGSLYPPRIHPYFRGWDEKDVEKIKTTGRVLMDGTEVVRGRVRFYDSPPNWVFEGRDPAGTNRTFAGRISDVERLPPRRPDAFGLFSETGVWRIQMEIPSEPVPGGYPVLGSGVAGHGNLLLLEVMTPKVFRFRLDQWGHSISSSPPMEAPGAGPHRVEIFVGPQVAIQKMPADWNIDPSRLKGSASLLRVWLDGSPVWDASVPYNQDSYDLVSIGSNPQGFSTARMLYVGTIRPQPYSDAEKRAFIERNLRETESAGR
jgi:hypothetical protein